MSKIEGKLDNPEKILRALIALREAAREIVDLYSLKEATKANKKEFEIVVNLKEASSKRLTEREKKILRSAIEKMELSNERELNKIIDISSEISGIINPLGPQAQEERREIEEFYKEIKKSLL